MKAGAERTVLFGCSPQTSEVSGSGIVEIDANDQVTSIKAFKAEKELLSAASLITIKELPAECSFDPSPVICVRLERFTTETAPQIPTLSTTSGGEKGDNEPSGEPGAAAGETGGEEDVVVDDSVAVVGGDQTGGAGGDQTGGAPSGKAAAATRLLLHLAAVVVTTCLLLS